MKIIVACGSGIASSTVIASKISQLLKRNNIAADIFQCSLNEVESNLSDASLIVSSIPGLKLNTRAPVLVAFPYTTGIGEEEMDDKILSVLRSCLETDN